MRDANKTRVDMVILSHLSDIQANPNDTFLRHRVNFVKYLIMEYKDTSVWIDVDEVHDKFCETHPNL